MLRIYEVCLQMVRDMRGVDDEIERADRDLARQLAGEHVGGAQRSRGGGIAGRDAAGAVSHGAGVGAKTRAAVDAAHAVGYVGAVDSVVLARLERIIGTLVRLIR